MADLKACLDALEAVSASIERGQTEVRTAITAQSCLIDKVAKEVSSVKHQLAANKVKDGDTSEVPSCGFCDSGDGQQSDHAKTLEVLQVLTENTENSARRDPPDFEEVIHRHRSKPEVAQPVSEVPGDTEEVEGGTGSTGVSRFAAYWKDEAEEAFNAEWNIKAAMGFETDAKKVNPTRSTTALPKTASPDAISANAQERAKSRMSGLQRFITSSQFDQLSGCIILIHSFSVGMEANERAMDPVNACGGVWVSVQLACNIIFVLELFIRMFSFGWKIYFCGSDRYWNFFDLLVITGGFIEEIIQRAILTDCERDADTSQIMTMLTGLRILRILRMTRIVRAVRFMNVFRELRVMVHSVLGCLIPLFWCIVLLFFIQWCFAIYFITVTADAVQGMHKNPEMWSGIDTQQITQEISIYYGSMWTVLYVLFVAITGGLDWSEAAHVFLLLQNYLAVWAFMFYIALVALAVLNVVTAVFVEYAMKMAAEDRDLVIQDYLEKESKFSKAAQAVFQEADADDSGAITFEEFTGHLEDLRVQAFLRSMELDGVEAVRLFKLLDADGNGSIEIDEFVQGCMCLRGNAKTLDLAMLLWEQRKAMKRWMSFMSYVDVKLNELTKQQQHTVSHAGSSPKLLQT